MKLPYTLVFFVLVAAGLVFADEPNPFLGEEASAAPIAAAGESFATLTEHILVPPDRLARWLEGNPLNGDAGPLRATVAGWIADGDATLDHTTATVGISGRLAEVQSGPEQIYATEYIPAAPGRWPLPTAFETRNLGYVTSSGADEFVGVSVLHAELSFSIMLPGKAWHRLMEATSKPGDMIFIPNFRSVRLDQRPASLPEADPFADPFAEPVVPPPMANHLRFSPGTVHLAARVADDLRSGVERQPARLIFFRGDFLEHPPRPMMAVPQQHQIAAQLVRVNHRVYSEWLQKTELALMPNKIRDAAMAWSVEGIAAVVAELSASARRGTRLEVADVSEFIYPTQWSPSEGETDELTPNSFETRNLGASLECEIIADPAGSILKVALERVLPAGLSIHHRVPQDGEWLPNITFPRFNRNSWRTQLRIVPGQWMFLGSGADVTPEGALDPEHVVLAFVKVE